MDVRYASRECPIIFITISLGHTVLNLRIEYEYNQFLQTFFCVPHCIEYLYCSSSNDV